MPSRFPPPSRRKWPGSASACPRACAWCAAAVVAVVIPLSLLTAFVMMHTKGVAANLISLGAVDFGIIIDGAVVLVEALMVRLAVAHDDNNPLHSRLQWK